MRYKLLALACLLCLTAGCATTTSVLARLSLGMTKDEVRKSIGNPAVVRDAIRNPNGEIMEVWEYQLQTVGTFRTMMAGMGAAGLAAQGVPVQPIGRTPLQAYWLYFVDSKLVQWRQAGE